MTMELTAESLILIAGIGMLVIAVVVNVAGICWENRRRKSAVQRIEKFLGEGAPDDLKGK